MASQNKKNKAVNSYVFRGKSIRETDKLKRIYFYNASLRNSLKKELRREVA